MNRAAAALARKRWAKRAIEKTCPFCGATFLGDPVQTYCRPSHQNAAAVQRFRARHQGEPSPSRRPATTARAPAEGLAHALAQAERCRAADDLAGAERWEQTAQRIAVDIAGERMERGR